MTTYRSYKELPETDYDVDTQENCEGFVIDNKWIPVKLRLTLKEMVEKK